MMEVNASAGYEDPAGDSAPPSTPHHAVSVQDLLLVLGRASASVIDDLATGRSFEQLGQRWMGLPMKQTVRLPDGRYVTCGLFAADEEVPDLTALERIEDDK